MYVNSISIKLLYIFTMDKWTLYNYNYSRKFNTPLSGSEGSNRQKSKITEKLNKSMYDKTINKIKTQ